MPRLSRSILVAMLAAGCGAEVQWNGQTPSTAGGNLVAPSFDGLPCEVALVLKEQCASCHGTTPTAGAPYGLTTLAELSAAAPGFPGSTVAQRCLARMAQSSAPMPPGAAGQVSSANQLAFSSWVTAGMPAGSCAAASGPAPTTCVNGRSGVSEGRNMQPGAACKGCHVGNGEARGHFYMGTVLPNAHEQTDCNGQPASNLEVDILDPVNGQRVLTMSLESPSGNFYSQSTSPIGSSYRAQVRNRTTGATVQMQGAQTDGNCNSCHSEQGASGARGRILGPQ